MNKRKRGGFSNLVISAIWLVVVAGVILAAINAMGANSIEEALIIAKNKAAYYSECIPSDECGIVSILKGINSQNEGIIIEDGSNVIEDNSNNQLGEEFINRETKGYRGPIKGEPYVNNAGIIKKDSALEMLNKIPITSNEPVDVEYSRSEWKHWSTIEGKPCWNIRNEILHRDAKPNTVIYIDKKMNSTTNYDEACAIGKPVIVDGQRKINTENSGEWIDPYTGRQMTSSSDIDIDHVVSLSYAAKNGGHNWSLDKKKAFANDLDNLLATSAKSNRTKGDKGPSKYVPSYKAYHCQYAKTYTTIINKYNLSIDKSDYDVLEKMLDACQH